MKQKRNNKGFTLVELIVVLVILAILAAILVPALLGYIDRAKDNQDMLKAKNMLNAAQAVLTEYYAFGNEGEYTENKDSADSEFARRVREVADDNPYLVIVGVGDPREDSNTTKHEQYTAYFIIYWESYEENPIFFNGTKWSTEYPWEYGKSGHTNNYFTINGERKALNFITIANNTGKPNSGNGNYWSFLQTTMQNRGIKGGSSGPTQR